MGSDGKSTVDSTKTTTQNLTPEQQKLVGLSMPAFEQIATGTPTLPGAAGVAGFDPLQTLGQNTVLAGTDTQKGVVSGAAGANQWLTSGAALDPDTNPYTRKVQEAAVRPIYDNLVQKILPAISADASTSGTGGISANYGGSRHGIAQGLATQSANDAAASATASVGNNAYDKGLAAMLSAMGQSNAVAAGQSIPGSTISSVGDVRQQQAQKYLTAEQQAQQFLQFLPYIKASALAAGAGSLPGGSTTATGSQTKEISDWEKFMGIGGLAVGGLSALSGFMPGE